jgi:salicylate hydroxylase
VTPAATNVSVIGAGLGGLTAALALQRAGRRVKVYERATVLGEAGAGITLSTGALRGLVSLGLKREILAASHPIPEIAFVHFRSGALLAGKPQSAVREDFTLEQPRHIHRADLHAILLTALLRADRHSVVTGKCLTRLDQDDARVIVGFADGTTLETELLVAADGARSAIRNAGFKDPPPQFARQIAFRCLIPREQAAPFMRGIDAMVFVGDSRVFNRYVIRDGTLVNVIGIAKSDSWREEGWNTPATVGEFLEAFEGFHADVLGLITRAPAATLIKWGLFVRPPVRDWSFGRVVLIGDAAHPILPFLGLGAALAIEDGIVLSRALDAAPHREAAFAAFQNARMERVAHVREASIRQGEIIQASNPDKSTLAVSPSQNAAIFAYDPVTVPLYF